MRRIINPTLCILAGLILLPVLGFGYVWINEWKPASREVVFETGNDGPLLPDTLKILTWNTGYAGLGDDMDFFMDGGQRTRGSRERTAENLQKITEFLASCEADIILLQEVDRDSRRSYRTDQFVHYQQALPGYYGYFALNYKTPFVPLPVRNPMGKVESGMAIFSKVQPQYVYRHQYNSKFPFPVRLFNLKRGLLIAGFHISRESKAWIGVTHNTAYDTGGMRTTEMEQLYDLLENNNMSDDKMAIIGGDWNQTPPGYLPSSAELNDPYFSPQPISGYDLFDYFYDGSTPSVRYLYESLTPGTTASVIDFFMTSGDFRCLEIKTIDLGFRNSDHNPVMATFKIENPLVTARWWDLE